MTSSTTRSGGTLPPLLLLVLFVLCDGAFAQAPLGADGVERFTLGTTYGSGYGVEYLPTSVLGFPDSTARPTVPTIDPHQIVGLGLGGEIVLRFDRALIRDRPGADFVVFENAFRYTIGGKERVYAEPAEVSVSGDGVEWHAFPFDTLTLKGCAGVTPTDGRYDPLDLLSGGDRFDLALLGIDSIRYVRLHDVTAIPKGDTAHPFYDYTLNGFDLDAVVNLSSAIAPADIAVQDGRSDCVLSPSLSDGRALLRFRLDGPRRVRCTLFDAMGRQVGASFTALLPPGEQSLPLKVEAAGTYLLHVEREGMVPLTLRWIVVP